MSLQSHVTITHSMHTQVLGQRLVQPGRGCRLGLGITGDIQIPSAMVVEASRCGLPKEREFQSRNLQYGYSRFSTIVNTNNSKYVIAKTYQCCGRQAAGSYPSSSDELKLNAYLRYPKLLMM